VVFRLRSKSTIEQLSPDKARVRKALWQGLILKGFLIYLVTS